MTHELVEETPFDRVEVLAFEDVSGQAAGLERELRGGRMEIHLTVTPSVAEGMARLAAGGFDAVVLDLDLGAGQGEATFARVQTAGLPVIVCAGEPDDALAEGLLRVGAEDFVVKGPGWGQRLGLSIGLAVERRRRMQREARVFELETAGAREAMARRVDEWSARLRESEERFRLLADNLKDYAILMLDPNGRVVSWSPCAERTKGYTSEEILGRHFSIFYARDDVQRGHPEEILRIAEAEGHFEEDGWRIRKDGSRFWANVTISAMRDNSQRLRGFFKVTRDISGRKAAEEHLEAARQSAEDASQSKSAFLRAISHEVRTPMHAILGMADLLSETSLSSDQHVYVDTVCRAGASLLGLINDVLDIAKIEAGRLELDRIEFDPEEVVEQAVELVAGNARAKGLALRMHIAQGVERRVTGDPGRLRHVLSHLLGNAIKFTEVGEVLLAVSRGPSAKPELEFVVSDTGIGIAADQIETIFKDFTQADGSTTRQYGGTGVGLAISRRIAEGMGGRLWATSEPGKGSTFCFTTHFEPAADNASKPPAPAPDFQGRRAAIVDGNATNRMILRETLSAWGLAADEYSSVEKPESWISWAATVGKPYSLVVVSRHMPGSDGFQTAAAIREVNPRLPVIMLTSTDLPGDQAKCGRLGFAGYAVRPIKRGDLLRLVSKALDGPAGAVAVNAEPCTRQGARRHAERSLRILIAEDSADNRLLLELYLKGSPHVAVFVENGEVAVEKFRNQTFDLFLTDLQMPVMDGLTAARMIRAIEGQRGGRAIPIVALSANSRPEDVRTSLEAGCNGHLAKPISRNALLAGLREFAPAEEKKMEDAEGIPPEVAALVPAYVGARKQEVPKLLDLLERREFEEVGRMAHNIKGTGAAYGFPKLTSLGAAMQASAKAADPDELGMQLRELQSFLAGIPVR